MQGVYALKAHNLYIFAVNVRESHMKVCLIITSIKIISMK